MGDVCGTQSKDNPTYKPLSSCPPSGFQAVGFLLTVRFFLPPDSITQLHLLLGCDHADESAWGIWSRLSFAFLRVDDIAIRQLALQRAFPM